ncbi:MAG TPA: SpoIID/LytB domain-containing protein [Spirochaetota bacterium]|nr:SpoIID/LytB domain-containing protein [Spirochaetota bacterium]
MIRKLFLILNSTLILYCMLYSSTFARKGVKVLVYKGKWSGFRMRYHNFRVTPAAVYHNGKKYTFKRHSVFFKTSRALRIHNSSYTGSFICYIKGSYIKIINYINFEHYVGGVLRGEIASSWPMEAIKAQAVCARTYAYSLYLKAPSARYHLVSSEKHQVFKGTYKLNSRYKNAVYATRGIIMMYDRKPIKAFFHACCGGNTANSRNVWESTASPPYLKMVRCPYCKNYKKFRWQESYSFKEINHRLRKFLKNRRHIKGLKIGAYTGGRRVKFMWIYTERSKFRLSGNKFRLAMGAHRIASLKFRMKFVKGRVKFYGKGFGHGVGLCQWGAKTLADKGFDYRFILKYYFKNINFIKL